MEIGIALRNMGELATAGVLSRCAAAAETAGLDSIWVTDHVAIPPEASSGSDGRYLDPLATLAYLAAKTARIRLGTAVLILPYRPPLPTAKWVASIQELSDGRLELGVGVGWMQAEFRALGISRTRRGRDSDRVLDLLNRCFESETVTENGQTFLFRPCPARPPIWIGGAAPHALARAVRHGDGWMPVRLEPEALAEPVDRLRALAAEAKRAPLPVTVMTAIPAHDPAAARDLVERYRAAGAARLIHAGRYAEEGDCRATIDRLGDLNQTIRKGGDA